MSEKQSLQALATHGSSHTWMWAAGIAAAVIIILLLLGLSNPDMRQDKWSDDPDDIVDMIGPRPWRRYNPFWWWPW